MALSIIPHPLASQLFICVKTLNRSLLNDRQIVVRANLFIDKTRRRLIYHSVLISSMMKLSLLDEKATYH